jgi:hypothetical protein
MCSYDLDKFLFSSYIALNKIFPHVDEKDKILPCVVLAGFQLIRNEKVIGKESEGSPGSLLIGSFETPNIELIPPKSEVNVLREVITQAYKDPSTGWLKIKNVYEEYIQKEGELDESNNT